jgi:hypothetical protein
MGAGRGEKRSKDKGERKKDKSKVTGLKGKEAGKLEGWEDKKVRELKAQGIKETQQTTDNLQLTASNNHQRFERSKPVNLINIINQ